MNSDQHNENSLRTILEGLGNLERKADRRAQLCNLAESLFARAPQDFFTRLSFGALIELTEEVLDFYQAFIDSGELSHVRIHEYGEESERKKSTGILTAIGDRPFIIDTLTEFLRKYQLSHVVLLHPIIRTADGRRVSLVYIEVQKIGERAEREKLEKLLALHFSSLIVASDDFSAMLVRVETAARLTELSQDSHTFPLAEREEAAQFLRWLADGGFVFLGHCEWKVLPKNKQANGTPQAQALSASALGLFRLHDPHLQEAVADLDRDVVHLLKRKYLFYFSKVLSASPVHRFEQMDVVMLRLPANSNGEEIVIGFLGLLTSKANTQEALSIPIIRRKLQDVLEMEGLLPNTYDYKEVISIADSLPKNALLRGTVESIREDIGHILSMQRRNAVRVTYRLGPMKRFVQALIVVPRERLASGARVRFQYYLEQLVGAEHGSSEYRLSLAADPFVTIHLLTPNPSGKDPKLDIKQLEKTFTDFILTWDDRFQSAFSENPSNNVRTLGKQWLAHFPEEYKSLTSPETAIAELETLANLSVDTPLELLFSQQNSTEQVHTIRLLKYGAPFTLSEIVPYLENCGFAIISEQAATITLPSEDSITIYSLDVSARVSVATELHANELRAGMKMVLLSRAENDRLNHLLVSPGLNIREVALLRTMCRYLFQIKAFPSDTIIINALINNPLVAKALTAMFFEKFQPSNAISTEQRLQSVQSLQGQVLTLLKQVPRLIEDRVLRAIQNVIDSTLRTDFFVDSAELRISLKIDCSKISTMPNPRPMYEIFVNAPDFEAVHLRAGKVARGGLRWSERPEDFRTEILGLMKTQTLKNSIIVPTGAKGGFIVKHLPETPTEISIAVEKAYRRFIEALLIISDNLDRSTVKPPMQVLRYDGDDPYLVVAADKGTASFSDVANGISGKFYFWLEDAFASGGSNGYDHKKLAITARGAWEAAQRHFRELGIDVSVQTFTVVGIGDMSGDVFGNGLLRSKKAKLIAAFNHKHIFVDPDPDPETSFTERKRLFDLPRSQWSDYRTELLSTGGGVYLRSEKEIALSEQARRALGVQQTIVSGEELVRLVLLAPVDLLWNGGIGTYVKSSEEDHLSVSDRSTADVRIDARDLRAKIAAEGGNLGFTQRARIEYSRIGGRINTDAVDNSGGVNLSDVEVNLKVLLREQTLRGALSHEERNVILRTYAEASCAKVLERNSMQSLVLSIETRRSRKNLDAYRILLAMLEKEQRLSRKFDHLPDEETLQKRAAMKAGLSRPELAVLLGYARIWLFDVIIQSDIPQDILVESYLFGYFPSALHSSCERDMRQHPLKREIIATELANRIVDRMGSSFVYRLVVETGYSEREVIRSFLLAELLLDGQDLVESLRAVDTAHSSRQHIASHLKLGETLEAMTRWILEARWVDNSLPRSIEQYRQKFRQLCDSTSHILPPLELTRAQESHRQLIGEGFPEELAEKMYSLTYAAAFLDVVHLASALDIETIHVAKVYLSLAHTLSIRHLIDLANDLETIDQYEAMAIRGVVSDLRRSISALTRTVLLSSPKHAENALDNFFVPHADFLNRYRMSCDEFLSRPISLAALVVLSKQLDAMARIPIPGNSSVQ